MAFFPDHQIADAGIYATAYFQHLAAAAKTVDPTAIAAAGKLLAARAAAGSLILSCGNGGSAAIANHLVCDCLKGIRADTNLRPKVHSLSTTVETITAIGNDIGYEQIFSFQLESLGEEGDVLIAISSSGSSPNIIAAIQVARRRKMHSIAMTGFGGGEAARLADISLHVDAENYGVVEDTHQSIMHILAQYLRQAHFQDPSKLGSVKF